MPTLAAAVLLVCVIFAAVAVATSAISRGKPSVSVSAPGEVLSGARFAVTGRISPESFGPIVVQANRGDGWRTIGRGSIRGHRFKVACALAGAGMVRLRAEFGFASRSPTRSGSRRVLVRAVPLPPPSPDPVATTPPPAATPPPTTQAAASPPALPEVPPSIAGDYWGAWFDGNPSPEDTAALGRFERLAGKPLSILEAYSSWGSCSSTCPADQPFPRALFEKIRAYGAIPLYSWASEANGLADEPEYQLSDIIERKYDPYIESWAKAAKAWGHPFFLRFDWEMNGTWFPWAEKANGNKPGEFVTAWQHVHDIFTRVGATNVSWVWSPYANPTGNPKFTPTSTLYPGDAYVDWTGIDGYNQGTVAKGTWKTFAQVFGPDYAAITALAPSKPMLLPEVACAEKGGSKAAWIEEMFAQLPTAFPAVRGFLWFDHDEQIEGQSHEWPIETSASATAAFAAGVASSRYLPNSLGALPNGPVPVPTG